MTHASTRLSITERLPALRSPSKTQLLHFIYRQHRHHQWMVSSAFLKLKFPVSINLPHKILLCKFSFILPRQAKKSQLSLWYLDGLHAIWTTGLYHYLIQKYKSKCMLTREISTMTDLHFKSKLLHFFKEIMNNKSLDKIRIQVVHYVFCSAKLKENRRIRFVLIHILQVKIMLRLKFLT